MPTSYESAIAVLNEQQRDSLSLPPAPVLVLAPPGSGKTQTLTCRIAKTLGDTATQRWRVLALTFTNQAADEMRARLLQYCNPTAVATRLHVSTFHSFACFALRHHGAAVGVSPNFSVMGQDESLQLAEQAANSAGIDAHRGISHEKLNRLLLMRKKDLVSPEAPGSTSVPRAYRELIPSMHQTYDCLLSQQNALDFDSLLSKVYELFVRNPEILSIYQTTFPDVCVDEFQDTTYAQYAILGFLTRRAPRRIFVVADADQSIYGWNGATARRVDQFVRDYSPTIMRLRRSYRASERVASAANRLISFNPSFGGPRLPIETNIEVHDVPPIRYIAGGADEESEAEAVARDILVSHAGHFGSVLVLARTRRILEHLQRKMAQLAVPCCLHVRKDSFQSPLLMLIESCLKLLGEPSDSAEWGRLLDESRLLGLIGESSGLPGYLGEFARSLMGAGGNGSSSSSIIGHAIAQWVVQHPDPGAFSESIFAAYDLDATGLKSSDPTPELTREEIAVWRELSRSIRATIGASGEVDGFLQEMALRSKNLSQSDSVQLMTIHASKGLEADFVYIIAMVEGQLPSYWAIQGDASPEDIEEERRICYVAVTRARRSVALSAAATYFGRECEPSRFLREMGVI